MRRAVEQQGGWYHRCSSTGRRHGTQGRSDSLSHERTQEAFECYHGGDQSLRPGFGHPHSLDALGVLLNTSGVWGMRGGQGGLWARPTGDEICRFPPFPPPLYSLFHCKACPRGGILSLQDTARLSRERMPCARLALRNARTPAGVVLLRRRRRASVSRSGGHPAPRHPNATVYPGVAAGACSPRGTRQVRPAERQSVGPSDPEAAGAWAGDSREVSAKVLSVPGPGGVAEGVGLCRCGMGGHFCGEVSRAGNPAGWDAESRAAFASGTHRRSMKCVLDGTRPTCETFQLHVLVTPLTIRANLMLCSLRSGPGNVSR